jgi:hypothetical protein
MPPVFFVPEMPDAASAEQTYQAIRTFVHEQAPGWAISDRRIYQLDYTHHGRDYRSRVGAIGADLGEPVFAIFEAVHGDERLYYVCTPNRGVLGGVPFSVGGGEIRRIADFAKYA